MIVYGAVRARLKKMVKSIPFLHEFYFAKRLEWQGRRLDVVYERLKKSGETPLFQLIEIETLNRCNGGCAFCPVNRRADPRVYQKMSEGLFRKIIEDLKELDYAGTLSLYSNNEPFLDSRIEDFAATARAALPKAAMILFTNGTVLTLDRFFKIIPHLDELVIDNYNEKLTLNAPVRIIHDYCRKNPDINRKVKIYIRRENEVLSSRGGLAPNKKNGRPRPMICLMPFEQLIVRPDGKVSLCCNDPFGKVTLGDLSVKSVKDVWYAKEYENIRAVLTRKNGREMLEPCKFCDVASFHGFGQK